MQTLRISYQVQGRPSAQKLHDDPELDAFGEARLVFGDIRALAGAEQTNLGLDVGQFIGAVFEVDLEGAISQTERGRIATRGIPL